MEYLTYVRNLGFEDLPDYKYLKGLFRKVMQAYNFSYDNDFDWVVKRKLKRKAVERQRELHNKSKENHLRSAVAKQPKGDC